MERLESLQRAVDTRLEACYAKRGCDWDLFYKPRMEKANFASRYHLVYPALGYFIRLRQNPKLAERLRPLLDNIYYGLISQRCWTYWYTELNETTWPLEERNLTYAGRLATFVAFYSDAFGAPPTAVIELGGRSITYTDLSLSLWEQMIASPSCGVSCYHHQSMVMCNAHLLINNVLHDRLYGTTFANANEAWVSTVTDNLTRAVGSGPIFYYGTESGDARPRVQNAALGADIWALFLMSAILPGRVANWFDLWRNNIVEEGNLAHIEVSDWEKDQEFSSDELATAWAFCLAQELGDIHLAKKFSGYLARNIEGGFERDPYISGLYMLGSHLAPGSFRKLVTGRDR